MCIEMFELARPFCCNCVITIGPLIDSSLHYGHMTWLLPVLFSLTGDMIPTNWEVSPIHGPIQQQLLCNTNSFVGQVETRRGNPHRKWDFTDDDLNHEKQRFDVAQCHVMSM